MPNLYFSPPGRSRISQCLWYAVGSHDPTICHFAKQLYVMVFVSLSGRGEQTRCDPSQGCDTEVDRTNAGIFREPFRPSRSALGKPTGSVRGVLQRRSSPLAQ